MKAVSAVCLFEKIFPAPAVACYAEEQIHKASQGQQVVGNDEILQILYGASRAKGAKPLHKLKPSTQGMDRMTMAMPLMMTAFFRLQPHRSIAKLRIFSKTAMMVDRAAKVIKTKNSAPQKRPPVI